MLQIPEPNQNLDSILYAIFYLLWPIFFACFLFIFVLQIQFSPGEPSDEERYDISSRPVLQLLCM